MHQVDTSGHVSNHFSDGDPLVPTVPTQVDAAILNAFQDELANGVTLTSNLTLIKGTNTQLAQVLELLLSNAVPGGRLTLTTAMPVTTSDVTGATTIRYTPFKHDKVMLFDGSRWRIRTFTELSQATTDTTKSPAAVANNSNYDLFVWDDAGTLRLSRGPLWSSDTARGTGAGTTELERLNGRMVNKYTITNGPFAQRGLYVGTVRSNGSAQINDSASLRHVWNAFNRVIRNLQNPFELTDSWSYTTFTVRQANNSTSNQFDLVIGLAEEPVRARVYATVLTNGSGGGGDVGIGVDGTSRTVGTLWTQAGAASAALGAGLSIPTFAEWQGHPGIGRHFFTWLERGASSGTSTWYGDNNGGSQSGLIGEFLA